MLRKLIMFCRLSLRPRAESIRRPLLQRPIAAKLTQGCRRAAAQRCLVALMLAGSWVLAGSGVLVRADERVGSSGEPAVAAPVVTAQHAAELIEDLAAESFAQRERAMGELMRLGGVMAPYLREAIQTHQDPELILRAKKALQQMTEDDLEAQIQVFLSADPDAARRGRAWFEGWAEVEQLLGDSLAVRELFIQVMRSHPKVTASLAANTDQRTAAAEHVAASVQIGMTELGQPPTLADGIAMLLPLNDPAVQVGAGYEATLMSVFNRQYAEARRDTQLWPPVSVLLQRWLLRSRLENRADALWYSMQWELPAGSKLGLRTLEETTDVETLQTALQAIARFGSVEDAPKLAKLLDDERPAVLRMPVMVDDQPLKVMLADVALAAIATLYKVPHKELQMHWAMPHDKVGFSVDHAGYTADQAEQRAAALERARRWCNGQPPRGEPRS